MNGASALPLLQEIEKVIDEYLGGFKKADNDNKDRVIREAKTIKKQIWAEKRDKDREEEKLLNIEKQKKKQQEKDSKVVIKIGKPAMQRSTKPAVKKQEVKKKILSEEEQDLRTYLEI
jgi:hypothetical protein